MYATANILLVDIFAINWSAKSLLTKKKNSNKV